MRTELFVNPIMFPFLKETDVFLRQIVAHYRYFRSGTRRSKGMKGFPWYFYRMKFRAAMILLALLTSSACYIYGAIHQTNDRIYTGIRSLNASDYSTHLSWIEQSREGQFLMQNKFTSEPQTGAFVRPVYFLLSQPFRLFNFSNTVVLHILRILCGILLLILLFPILRQFEENREIVNRTFLLLAFTSGIGFLLSKWMIATDLEVPE